MDQDWIVYIACVIGAAGLYLVLSMRRPNLRLLGGIVALGAFAWLLVRLPLLATGPQEVTPPVLFYVFAFIAVAAAVRMISHSRPVYSALYFVLVVLSSAAIFLLLEAEFMAFALVIVYAGAILITYLFVLMLSQQAPAAPGEGTAGAAEYDVNPHEPAAGVFIGFLLLALLGQVVFSPEGSLPPPTGLSAYNEERIDQINRMDRKREAIVERFREARPELPPDSRIGEISETGVVFLQEPAGRRLEITFEEAGLNAAEVDDLLIQNIERVGMALVHKFPVSLELAGIILLLAMFGAVVLARKQIELSEDEKREAAGLRRLSVEPQEAAHRVESVEDSKRLPQHRPGPRGGGA